MSTDFELELVEHPAQLIIALSGDLTSEAGQKIRHAYTCVRERGCRAVVFDFSKVNYINSEGVAIFFSLVRDMGDGLQEMVFASLTQNMQNIIKVVGLIDYVHLADTVDSWFSAHK